MSYYLSQVLDIVTWQWNICLVGLQFFQISRRVVFHIYILLFPFFGKRRKGVTVYSSFSSIYVYTLYIPQHFQLRWYPNKHSSAPLRLTNLYNTLKHNKDQKISQNAFIVIYIYLYKRNVKLQDQVQYSYNIDTHTQTYAHTHIYIYIYTYIKRFSKKLVTLNNSKQPTNHTNCIALSQH